MRHTIAVLVENKPGVLARVAGLFRRRGYNIESLAVGPTQDPTISRMTIVVEGDQRVADQMVRQLDKLLDVLRVEELPQEDSVSRELALIKVRVPKEQRGSVIQVVDVFRANVVDVGRDTLVVEVTGEEEKVNALIELLQDYGIVELARTGKIALSRGAKAIIPEEEAGEWPGFTTTGTPI